MPSGDICTANIGTPWPLAYGFFRATGMRQIEFTLPSTGVLPLMQLGFWDLGEGELDGCSALWNDKVLQFAYDSNGNLMGYSTVGVTASDPTTTGSLNAFSFHSGCDGVAGTSVTGQKLDPLWGYIGSLVTPLNYSRRAYYAIGWTPPTDGSSSLAPVGDFRGMRCRTFGATGNQTGYGFTTNPIWHFVDLWLRRAIKPEYALSSVTGPDLLTSDEAACFNWPSVYQAAQDCAYILPNGQPRFSGSYVFASGSTLASMLEQVLLCCRGYWYEYAGQIYVFVDKPRASTFTASSKHYVTGSLSGDNAQVNQNANRYIGSFLELGLPAVASIATIARTDTQVTIDTVSPNPCATDDLISVGGVDDSSFDANYNVAAVPSNTEIDCTISGGVAASSTGGSIGYIQSRFSQRSPEISHRQHQIAQGQILPPNVTGTRLKRIKVSYDFANCTYDQAMRLLQYEVYRDLGLDQTPYLPPWTITLSLFSESVDAAGNALKAQLPGDVITLDSSILYELAGDFEIMERFISPFQLEVENSTDGSFTQPAARNGALSSGLDSNSGILKLVLRSFNPSATIFTDVSVAPSASFATVPGQLPYAGADAPGSGSGFTILAGTMTVSTPYAGIAPNNPVSHVSWSEISIRVGGGLVLAYRPQNANIHTDGEADQMQCLYISDPGLAGGYGCVFVSATDPAPGTGVFILLHFYAPAPPQVFGTSNTDTDSLV